MSKLVECVPNFSEGRRHDVIDLMVQAVSIAEVRVLDLDINAGANRSVITFVAPPEAAIEAGYQLYRCALKRIDMRKHAGAHPRIGAVDVFPFVPLRDVSMQECVQFAKLLGARVGETFNIPVYLYENAASSAERRSLAFLRKGEYEGLETRMRSENFTPDFGPHTAHAAFGASVIGARPFLIAYNINLNTRDKTKADWIAKRIRESGYKERLKNGETREVPGIFKCTRAIGWYIEEYQRAQVSINFTNFEVTPVHEVFDRVCELAEDQGVRVTGSELIGLIPKQALLSAAAHYAARNQLTAPSSEKERVALAINYLGLADLGEFDTDQKVIEYRLGWE